MMSLAVSGLDCPQNKLMHVPSDIIHPAQVQLPESSKQVPKAAFNLSKLSEWLRRGCLDPCVSLSLTAGTWGLMCTQCSPACPSISSSCSGGRAGEHTVGSGGFPSSDQLSPFTSPVLEHSHCMTDPKRDRRRTKNICPAQKGSEWAC